MGLAGPAAALLHLPLLRAAPSLREQGVQGWAAVKTLLVPHTNREGEAEWIEHMLGTLGHDPSALPPPFTLGPASATAQAKGNTKQPMPHSGEDQFPGAKPAPALPTI